MSFDLEKGADASIQQPSTARLSYTTDPNSFPPTYEQHVNENMRNFSDEFSDVKLREFDGIQDPKSKQRKRKCPTWVWFTLGIAILIITGALLGGLIIHYTNKHDTNGDKVTTPAAPIRPITLALSETKIFTQTPMQTRSEQTTTVSPLTTTVFVTEAPPTTSTQVVITTLTPSTSTPSIITVTSTATMSSSESSSTSTSSTTTTAFEAPITVSEPTSTSLNPSEAALSSSIQAEISRNSAKLIPSPITTTLVSVTTATAVSISTPPPSPSPRLVPMPGGTIDYCGVPGTFCGVRRKI